MIFFALFWFMSSAQGSITPCAYPALAFEGKCYKSLDGGALDQKIFAALNSTPITIPEGWVISPVVHDLVSQASGAKCIAFDRVTYATTDKSYNCKYRLSSNIACPRGVPRNAAGCVVTQDENTRVVIMKAGSEEKQMAARFVPIFSAPPPPTPLATCGAYFMKPNASMVTGQLSRNGDGWIVAQDEGDCCQKCSDRFNSGVTPSCVGYQFVASVVNFQPYSTITGANMLFNIGYTAGACTSRAPPVLNSPGYLAYPNQDYYQPGVGKMTNVQFVGSSIQLTNTTYYYPPDTVPAFNRISQICVEGSNQTCAGFTIVPNMCYLYSAGTWGDLATGPQLVGSNVAFNISALYASARIEVFQQNACTAAPMYSAPFQRDKCSPIYDFNNNLIVYFYFFWNSDATYDFGFYANAACTQPVTEGQDPWTGHYYNVDPMQTVCRQSNIIKYVPSGKYYPTYWRMVNPTSKFPARPACFNNTC